MYLVCYSYLFLAGTNWTWPFPSMELQELRGWLHPGHWQDPSGPSTWQSWIALEHQPGTGLRHQFYIILHHFTMYDLDSCYTLLYIVIHCCAIYSDIKFRNRMDLVFLGAISVGPVTRQIGHGWTISNTRHHWAPQRTRWVRGHRPWQSFVQWEFQDPKIEVLFM